MVFCFPERYKEYIDVKKIKRLTITCKLQLHCILGETPALWFSGDKTSDLRHILVLDSENKFYYILFRLC